MLDFNGKNALFFRQESLILLARMPYSFGENKAFGKLGTRIGRIGQICTDFKNKRASCELPLFLEEASCNRRYDTARYESA